MSSAFVSHSSADDRYVHEMVQFVRTLGYDDVFHDGDTIAPDDLFWNRIQKGILDCDAFVVILSHASVQSHWVDREVQFARDHGKTVIPVRIDDSKLPPSFDGRDVIDLRQWRGDKVKIAPSRITKHSPKILFGRDHWLDALDAAWAKPTLNVYTLVAWGGVGKTSLVAHWVSQRMAAKGWPGVERYFDWSFYSQGTGESRQTSSDLFVQEALRFFDDPEPTKGGPWERGERLARLVRRHRTLLVLDGIEPLQYPVNDPQAGRLKDQALEALLQSLAADNPGLCLVTTREHLKNLENQATTDERKLDQLAKEAAIDLLRRLQIVGTEAEMEAAWKDAGGHALTLQLLGTFIADAYEDKDIRHYKEVKFEEADLERQGRSAFQVMAAYERWLQSAGPQRQRELAILRLTGLFDRPISRDSLQILRRWQIPSWFRCLFDSRSKQIARVFGPLAAFSDQEFEIALNRLGEVDLLTVTRDDVDAHPLIREYFAKQLRDTQPAAFRAAHSRLFDHLCETTEYRPETLAGLQPLYQAVVHGCLAGRQQEACDRVYFDRILRGAGTGGYYSTFRLGAIGADLSALAGFFEEPWSRVSPNLNDSVRAWLLNQAAFCLRALGRLAESVQPMEAALAMEVAHKNWQNAAIAAGNISELRLLLGHIEAAVLKAKEGVSFADAVSDTFRRVVSRTVLADALHQAGRVEESRQLFSAAESLQSEAQPEFPLLYSVRGYKYCDVLLSDAERSAWQIAGGKRRAEVDGIDSHLAACQQVESRALHAREWAHQLRAPAILDLALANLTLGRVGLLRAILLSDMSDRATALAQAADAISEGVRGLREANQSDDLCRGLICLAWLRFLEHDLDGAQAALDECRNIAARANSSLILADIALYRARILGDQFALNECRRLIELCGYYRRAAELADHYHLLARGKNIDPAMQDDLTEFAKLLAGKGFLIVTGPLLDTLIDAAKKSENVSAAKELFVLRARLRYRHRDYERARWDYKKFISLCQTPADNARLADAAIELADLERRSGLFDDAKTHLDFARNILERSAARDARPSNVDQLLGIIRD